MLPLYDENPTHRTPVLVLAIVLACTAVMVFEVTRPSEAALESFVRTWGLTPARLRPGMDEQTWWTPLTSMFLHGGWAHLAGNCWFLWVFGNNVEHRLGFLRFLLFYCVCGLAAAGTQALVDLQSTIPMVGASGAISGILGAYLRYFPKVPIITLTPLWFAPILPIPAWIFMPVWFGMQFWQGIDTILSSDLAGGVAWWAHVGGFLAGLVIARPLAPTRTRRPRRKG